MRIVGTIQKADSLAIISRATGVILLLAGVLLAAGLCAATPRDNSVPSICDSRSTPADSIHHLSLVVLSVTGLISFVVFSLLTYVIMKFRSRAAHTRCEPAQVYGSRQTELAWTTIPILIVVVLFLAPARVIHAIQDAPKPAEVVEVTAIGDQSRWGFHYPGLGVVTANEFHDPVSDPSRPKLTFLKLLSTDTDHSFWIPQLAGKTGLIPNRLNETRLDPRETGSFLGQCAQDCGTQTATDTAQKLADESATALKTARHLIKKLWHDALLEAAKAGNKEFAERARSADTKEAIGAFFEKRPSDLTRATKVAVG